MNDCIFCKIINKEIPADFVYEDDNVFCFNDIKPKAPVHILILPKKHLINLDSAEQSDSELISTLLLTAKKIASEKGINGAYKLTTNIGEKAGQTVFHMHFHLLGGWNSKEEVESQLKQ